MEEAADQEWHPTEEEPRPLGAFGVVLRGPTLGPKDVITMQPRVLLVHRKDLDLWNLPGGAIEGTERLAVAVAREVEEETGLIVRPITWDTAGMYSAYIHAPAVDPTSPVPGLRTRDNYALVLCVIEGGRLRETDESNQFGWFSLSNLPPNTYERHLVMSQIGLLANPQRRRTQDMLSLLYTNEQAIHKMKRTAK